MAQTKRKRRTKHRGNAVGMIEARGRTGRKPTSQERGSGAKLDARARREARMNKPPTWTGAVQKAVLGVVIFVLVFVLLARRPFAPTLAIGAVLMVFYIPVIYFMDQYMYRRRQRGKGDGR